MLSQKRISVVPAVQMQILQAVLRQCVNIKGEIWEMGVYQGGTALLFKRTLDAYAPADHRRLRLFDTFEGMPGVSSFDRHKEGDFADTSEEAVRRLVGEDAFIDYRKGWIPDTFRGLEDIRLAFCHVDVDIHPSVVACCEFCWPRLQPGGMVVFDDYGYPSCPGARKAVDEFFADKAESVICLPTGQALVVKLPTAA